MSREIVIEIPDDGPMRFIYDDRLRELLAHGEARISRASHVEPGDPSKGQDPLKWYADMSPVSGPVLAACDTREQALEKETEWLRNNDLGRGPRPQKAAGCNASTPGCSTPSPASSTSK